MGYMGWRTADTKEPIKIGSSIYLLQPNGEESLFERNYEGYGDIAGVDVFDWLSDRNIKPEILEEAERIGLEKRMLGIYMDDNYYIDTRDGKKFTYSLGPVSCGHVISFIDDNGEDTGYDGIYTGIEINELISTGIWTPRPLSELVCIDGEIKYPLKFSKDKNAVYEELEASEEVNNSEIM